MFFSEGRVRVHLCGQPVDMRKSYMDASMCARGFGVWHVEDELLPYIRPLMQSNQSAGLNGIRRKNSLSAIRP